MKIFLSIVLISVAVFAFGQNNSDSETWRFINISDYHNAEGLSMNNSQRPGRMDMHTELFREMKERYGGELIIMPGDCNNGEWYRTDFVAKFKENPAYENFTTEQVVLEAGRLCYGGLLECIHNGGYNNFLMAVGDHEIGDNPWKKGAAVVNHVATLRQGFSNILTLDEEGNSLFTEKIGNANPRPVGTIYEHTSNAIQYKNVLFVTLDIFRFDGKDINLGSQGVITGDITGEHLKWFESVLSEAQSISSIRHIVVQSHLPIIYPVRKYASSGMLVDAKESEKLLDILRKYKVDLYLAGEVHMNTITKDSKSDLVQWVARGNNASNRTVVDVTNDGFKLTCYHGNGLNLGELIIDKSTEQTKVEGSGVLKPINPKGLQIHWSFETQRNMSNYIFSVDGTFPKKGKNAPLLKNIDESIVYNNDGDFGSDYSLLGDNVEIAKGIIGNAVQINDASSLFVIPTGPFMHGYERTLSCWIKSTAHGRRLILNTCSFWGDSHFFNLSLNEGNLELALRPDVYTVTQNQTINDGEWHHLAVVLPFFNAKIKDLKLWVDGKLIKNKQNVKPETVVNTAQANWMAVATQDEAYKTDLRQTMNMQNFTGWLDDFSIWTRALTDNEISKLYEKGLEGINAMDFEKELGTGVFSNHIQKDSIIFYPNPTGNKLNIRVLENRFNLSSKITIYNAKGHVVKSISMINNPEKIDVSDLTRGIYFAQCADKTIKFIKT